jgi:hypothetical protein
MVEQHVRHDPLLNTTLVARLCAAAAAAAAAIEAEAERGDGPARG